MSDPCDFDVHGWDISGFNLYQACKRAKVLEPHLIEQLKEDLEKIVPMPAPLTGEFIAAN
jgi:myo-inositol-1-phosphate synthase